jgi:hypothetical protein
MRRQQVEHQVVWRVLRGAIVQPGVLPARKRRQFQPGCAPEGSPDDSFPASSPRPLDSKSDAAASWVIDQIESWNRGLDPADRQAKYAKLAADAETLYQTATRLQRVGLVVDRRALSPSQRRAAFVLQCRAAKSPDKDELRRARIGFAYPTKQWS